MRSLMFAAAVLFALPAQAEDDVLGCVRTKVWSAYGQGWSLRSMDSGEAKPSEPRVWTVTLLPGQSYRFLACGAKEGGTTELALYDDKRKVVARDAKSGRDPSFVVEVERLGTYYLAVQPSKGKGPTEAAIAVTYR